MTDIHSQNRCLGYTRVSTYGQTLDIQLEQLRAAGCTNRNIYREKVTGTRADRRELLRMLDHLAPGDVVTVTRIDRLARSTFDLFGIVKRIADAKAQFRSLAEPWADTGTSTGRLMLAVLGGLADVERDLIRTRTAEGRSRAKARGRQMGRPPALSPAQQKEATRRHAEGATLAEVINDTVKSHYFKVTSIPNEGLEEIDELPQNPPSLRIAYRQAIRATDANAQLAAAAMFRRALQVII
jgi:DNA invertase Pin-like site-specific DNA recombinase